jgi:cytochrome c oxidase subunit II
VLQKELFVAACVGNTNNADKFREAGLGKTETFWQRCIGWARVGPAGLAVLMLVACDGPQSSLDPAGYDARRLADLFWVMFVGALVIWVGVMALAFYAARRRDSDPPPEGAANLLILGGGIIFSIAVLTALLVYGLLLMGQLRAYSGAG